MVGMIQSLSYQRQYSIQESANEKYRFESESVLEDFAWDNLNALFKVTPLRRQHHVNGNYCDILAVGEKGNLVIIELKNDEDRYVVQQITRYYHQLIQEKPYQDKVDYQQAIELLVVSPYFHSDNLTDRLYHKLNIDFVQFSLANIDGEIIFKANYLDRKDVIEAKVPRHLPKPKQTSTIVEIPPVPRTLNTALAKCKHVNPDLILIAREKILKFDNRLQEIKLSPGDFIYGKGKSKPCAQITVKKETFDGKPEHQLYFGLWLPISLYSSFELNERVTRVIVSGLGVEVKKQDLLDFSLLQQGVNRRRRYATQVWSGKQYLWLFLEKALKKEVKLRNLDPSIKAYCRLKGYKNPTHGSLEYLEFFVALALDLWKERLEAKSK
jgi:hypothetical protein